MAAPLIPDPSGSSASTLRLVTNSAASSFLRLPQELRDIICGLTLVEPRLWENRQDRACSLYNPPVEFECPPFDNWAFEEDPDCPGWGWYRLHTCARRKSLGLLRVNKQIHEEASPVFWDNTTLCYQKPQDIWGDLWDLPSAWPKIKSLSFMNFREDYGRDVLVFGYEVVRVLAKMPNLREIELQASYSRQPCMPQLLDFRALKVIRILDLRLWCIAFDQPWEQTIYAAVARNFELPMCDDPTHAAEKDDVVSVWKRAREEQDVCQPCPAALKRIRDIAGEMHQSTIHKYRWVHVLARRLKRLDEPWTAEEAYTTPVKLRGSDKYLEARIWGMPTSSISQREKAYRRAQRGEKGPIPVAKAKVPVKFVSEEALEFESARKGRPGRSYRCQQQRVEQEREDRRKRLLERGDKEASSEIAQYKLAQKKATNAKRRGERELKAEKKAARKRGRRG